MQRFGWAAIVFTLVLPVQAAEAAPRKAARPAPRPVQEAYIGPFAIGNPNVFWSGTAVGAASTGAYFALRDKRSLKIAGDGRHFSSGAFALTTVGCMAVAPMLAAAVVWHTEGRYLTSEEALGLGAGCVIPIIGPLLVSSSYRAHPEWPR